MKVNVRRVYLGGRNRRWESVMTKRMNIGFFSICFLAALLAQAYCIHILEGDFISVMGIGTVVLITGYLLVDSIRSKWLESCEKFKETFEIKYKEETEKINDKYQELLNIQKATYTAIKKNDLMIKEQFDEVISRIDSIEKNHIKNSLKSTELLMKSLEGQKNSLNLELNYNKENTKLIMNTIKEECNKLKGIDQLDSIISLLEEISINNMKSQRNSTNENENLNLKIEKDVTGEYEKELPMDQIIHSTETIQSLQWADDEQDIKEEAPVYEEPPVIVPLYSDPNKALTKDEIASLFASYGQ